MGLVEFILKLMNIPIIKEETSREYFSRIKGILKEEGYYITESGLILDRKEHPEDYLGDIRVSKRKVIISPNRKYLEREASKLADFLSSQKIPLDYERN